MNRLFLLSCLALTGLLAACQTPTIAPERGGENHYTFGVDTTGDGKVDASVSSADQNRYSPGDTLNGGGTVVTGAM